MDPPKKKAPAANLRERVDTLSQRVKRLETALLVAEILWILYSVVDLWGRDAAVFFQKLFDAVKTV